MIEQRFHRLGSHPLIVLCAIALLAMAGPASARSNGPDARVEVREQSPYGRYLTDSKGRSLYLFEQDKQGGTMSTCVDACANTWPPYTVTGDPTVGKGVVSSKLGTIEREDDIRQVTYAGWPLYYFSGDDRPGDALGQDVEHLGGEWYLITPKGEKVVHGERSEAPDIGDTGIENPSGVSQ
ncbi:Predicted lipoprotein with conserved Yx(FWY)xxD motif [Modicisalibacter muralis]|uniref:Predicted lipoprotein with conserved Yx(FWY)xxD motif n=1 Tax=Modicisalibacter muralis TaxID=119000 RepID=A0A1G9QYV0_9GAMM|nr:hypothetical protein [Halomonas muralis]SDM16198.1 Predicted lipoprotein with conserved Yx(FWY)xxD motif [Halomonas muralis]